MKKKLVKRGEDLPQAKLTSADVRAIRYMATQEGCPISEVARIYGISRVHCWRVVHNLSWKHVPVCATIG